jgi:DNA-binding SARP family transcriptional activator
MELGRTDHALEVLGNDQSPAARDVRAEILWKKSDWTGAAALYESRLGERFRDTASPLTAEEESRLIRAGVGYSLARDTAALTRLSRNYMPFVERARSPASVRIALDGLDGMEGPAAAGDFAGLTANADTFTGWVNAMKTSLREKTAKAKTGGANAAAPAPARPQPAAAAAA